MSDLHQIRTEFEQHVRNADEIRDELEIVGVRVRQLRRAEEREPIQLTTEEPAYWGCWREGARRSAERIRPDDDQDVGDLL